MEPGSAAQRLVGTVRSFSSQWGFLRSEAVEGDIFVHLKDCPGLGAPLVQGDQVEFELSTRESGSGPAGKHNGVRAVNLRRVGGGHQHTGVVASFRDGWGLISSPSHEEKIFFGLKDNPQLRNLHVTAGDEVSFCLSTNAEGRLRAVAAGLVQRPLESLLGRRVRGTVKSFRDGWGFATSERFKGDVLLGRAALAKSGLGGSCLQSGDVIDFEVATGSGGRFQANAVQKVSGWPMALPILGAASLGVGGVGYGAAAALGYAGSFRNGPADRAAGRLFGTVRDFKDQWGFINSPLCQGDIFVHLKDNPGLGQPLRPGEAVEFSLLHKAPSGKHNGAHAINVRRLAAGSGWPAAQLALAAHSHATRHGAALTGVVVSFRDGWGLIQSPMLSEKLFIGLRDNPQLHDAGLGQGDWVRFEIGQSPDGRPRAVSATLLQKDLTKLLGQRVRGKVKSLSSGWGFATSDSFAGDVLLGKRSLAASKLDSNGALQPGDAIEFTLTPGNGGRYQAADIVKVS